MSEDSLKKRYRSIPIEERLPIGTLEPDETDLEELSSVDKEGEVVKQLFDDQNQLID